MAGLFDLVDREKFLDAVRRQEVSTNRDDPNAPLLPPSEMISSAGATGEMQIIPSASMRPGYGASSIFDAAEQLGFSVPPDMRTEENARMLANDPVVARQYAADYLSSMFDRFGSVDSALAAYNMGPGGFGSFEAGGRELPVETQEYYPNVRQFYNQATGGNYPVGISPRPQPRPSGLLEQMR